MVPIESGMSNSSVSGSSGRPCIVLRFALRVLRMCSFLANREMAESIRFRSVPTSPRYHWMIHFLEESPNSSSTGGTKTNVMLRIHASWWKYSISNPGNWHPSFRRARRKSNGLGVTLKNWDWYAQWKENGGYGSMETRTGHPLKVILSQTAIFCFKNQNDKSLHSTHWLTIKSSKSFKKIRMDVFLRNVWLRTCTN